MWPPPDNDTLVLLPSFHEVVGIVRNGKNVGWLLSYLLVTVLLDVGSIVDREELVGIDGYQDGAGVGLQREGGREGGRERRREKGREGGRVVGREGGRVEEVGREGGKWEGGRRG